MNASATVPTVDVSRAAGSETMGDSNRQESQTTESFTIVPPGSVGGSINSQNMSPDRSSNAAAPAGTLPPGAAANITNINARASGTNLSPGAQTFVPQNAQASSVAPIPIFDQQQINWWNYQLFMQQQQAMQYAMMGQGAKGEGLVPPAPPPYQAGPLPMPSALPPQSMAPQQTSS